MSVQIPIYRAKKIDSEEWVEGELTTYYEFRKVDRVRLLNNRIKVYAIREEMEDKYYCDYRTRAIDPSTLAIHFPDMLDKNDKKIWASLNESGIGGSLIKSTWWKGKDEPQNIMKMIYRHYGFSLVIVDGSKKNCTTENMNRDSEVAGIYEREANAND